jgi:hypothetical protein
MWKIIAGQISRTSAYLQLAGSAFEGTCLAPDWGRDYLFFYLPEATGVSWPVAVPASEQRIDQVHHRHPWQCEC